MPRKKDPSQMSNTERAVHLMSEHFEQPKSIVSGWDITHKLATALDEAEARGEARSSANGMLEKLMASAPKAQKAPKARSDKKDKPLLTTVGPVDTVMNEQRSGTFGSRPAAKPAES